MEKLSNFVEKLKRLDRKSIESYKYLIFLLIVVDMVGLYWYFGQKRLSLTLLMVLIIALIVFLLLEKRLPESKIDKKEKKEESENLILACRVRIQ